MEANITNVQHPRNALCPCGSQKKYKRCCLHKDEKNLGSNSVSNGIISVRPKINEIAQSIKDFLRLDFSEACQLAFGEAFNCDEYKLYHVFLNGLTAHTDGKPKIKIGFDQDKVLILDLDYKDPKNSVRKKGSIGIAPNGDVLYGNSTDEESLFFAYFLFFHLISQKSSYFQKKEFNILWSDSTYIKLKSIFHSILINRGFLSKDNEDTLRLSGFVLSKPEYDIIDYCSYDGDSFQQIISRYKKNITETLRFKDAFQAHRNKGVFCFFFFDQRPEAKQTYKYLKAAFEDRNTFYDKLIFEQVSFVFNDGTHLSLDRVYEHPYSLILEEECFLDPKYMPKQLKNAPIACEFTGTQNYNGYVNSDQKNDSLLILGLLIRLSEKKYKDFTFYLTSYSGFGNLKNKKSLIIKNINYLELNKSLELCLDEKQLKVNLKGVPSGERPILINKNLIFYPESSELYIHTMDRIYQELEPFFNELSLMGITSFPNYQMIFELNKNNTCALEQVLERVSDLSKKYSLKFNHPKLNLVSLDNVKLLADVDGESPTQVKLGYRFTFNDKEFLVEPDFSTFANIVRGFQEGIAAFIDKSNPVLVTQGKGEKRALELKLLRHKGFYHFFIAEALAYSKFFYDLQGKIPIETWLEHIIDQYAHCLSNKTDIEQRLVGIFEHSFFKKYMDGLTSIPHGKPQIDWKESAKALKHYISNQNMVSSKCSKKFKKSLESLFLKLVNELTQKNRIFNLKNEFYSLPINTASLDFYLLILMYLFNDKSIQFLSKSPSKALIFMSMVMSSGKKNRQEIFFDGALRSLVFGAAFNKYQLRINSFEIEDLPDGAFSHSLEMGDNAFQDSGEIDWFELNPKVFFRSEEVSLGELLKNSNDQLGVDNIIEFKGKYYRISPNELTPLKWLKYFWDKMQAYKQKDTGRGTEKNKNIYETKASDFFEILALKRAGIRVIGNKKWQEVSKKYDELSGESKLEASIDFVGELKEYQKEGLYWLDSLYGLKIGGILADDMGLGKTIQALAFLDSLRLKGKLKNTLVVVPTSLIYNWQTEAQKFTPLLNIKILEGPQFKDLRETKAIENETVYITTYGLALNNEEYICDETLHWDIAIFDEAQNLKNISSKRTQLARKLNSQSKFCLSGTPLENNLLEFYSLVDICLPGLLGSYQDFSRTFNNAEKKKINIKDIEFLKLKTKPIVLRRTKQKILSELPEKVESIVPLVFEKSQERVYRDTAISWNEKIQALLDSGSQDEKNGHTQLHMLTALLRLRQVCTSPNLIPDSNYMQVAPKVSTLVEHLSELNTQGSSALVFTTFKESLFILQKKLNEAGLFTLCIHGGVSREERKKILTRFENVQGPVFLLMTLKTGGVGLNLTKAQYVFHVEPWWNPAVENQASDRAHRLGQTQKVNVYRYIMKDSIEEKILELKVRKSEIFNQIFECENFEEFNDKKSISYSKGLSKEDFKFLLSDYSNFLA